MVGAVSRGRYEERVRELIERADYVFVAMIEAMLDVRRAIFDGYERLHQVLLRAVQHVSPRLCAPPLKSAPSEARLAASPLRQGRRQ